MNSSKLFNKNFTYIIIGQIISLFGNAILRFALPLYLLKVTNSPALFGIVMALSFLPMVIMTLIGGIISDRSNKRNVMVILDSITALLMLFFLISYNTLSLVPLISVTLMLLYSIQGMYQPTVQASIPFVLQGENIIKGNAVINQISALASLLGPVLGGILLSNFGIYSILMISIVCFIGAAIMETFINIPFEKKKKSTSVIMLVKSDLSESFKYMYNKNKNILKMSYIIGLFNLVLTSMIIIGMPIIFIQILNVSDQQYGISQSIISLGAIAGGICVGVMSKKLTIKHAYKALLIAGLALLPIFIVLNSVTSTNIQFIVVTGMMFIIMSTSTVFTIQVLSYVQMTTPPAIIGKVISLVIAFAMAAQPIGQLIYGVLFERFFDSAHYIVLGAAIFSIIISLSMRKTCLQASHHLEILLSKEALNKVENTA